MIAVKTVVTKAAMSGLYHSGAHRLLARYTQGAGVIFTLNHVRPPQAKAFAPNREERKLGTRPIHLSFPYGDEGAARARDFALAKELGFKTAMTTRKGALFPRTVGI